LSRIWQPGLIHWKAGVLLYGFDGAGAGQMSLLAPDGQKRAERLMQKLDAINGRFGKGSVCVAVAVGQQGRGSSPWHGQQHRCTPAYTTNWDELWQIVC